jgi:L-iditol 2-dehydrogenase
LGAKTVLIADIQADRVNFAVHNGFADEGLMVPRKQCQTVEEKLAFAKEVAGHVHNANNGTRSPTGEVDGVFECTGVETCLQAAIYVSQTFSLAFN